MYCCRSRSHLISHPSRSPALAVIASVRNFGCKSSLSHYLRGGFMSSAASFSKSTSCCSWASLVSLDFVSPVIIIIQLKEDLSGLFNEEEHWHSRNTYLNQDSNTKCQTKWNPQQITKKRALSVLQVPYLIFPSETRQQGNLHQFERTNERSPRMSYSSWTRSTPQQPIGTVSRNHLSLSGPDMDSILAEKHEILQEASYSWSPQLNSKYILSCLRQSPKS